VSDEPVDDGRGEKKRKTWAMFVETSHLSLSLCEVTRRQKNEDRPERGEKKAKEGPKKPASGWSRRTDSWQESKKAAIWLSASDGLGT